MDRIAAWVASTNQVFKVLLARSYDYQRARGASVDVSVLFQAGEWSLHTGAERGEHGTLPLESNTCPLSTSRKGIVCWRPIGSTVWLGTENSLLGYASLCDVASSGCESRGVESRDAESAVAQCIRRRPSGEDVRDVVYCLLTAVATSAGIGIADSVSAEQCVLQFVFVGSTVDCSSGRRPGAGRASWHGTGSAATSASGPSFDGTDGARAGRSWAIFWRTGRQWDSTNEPWRLGRSVEGLVDNMADVRAGVCCLAQYAPRELYLSTSGQCPQYAALQVADCPSASSPRASPPLAARCSSVGSSLRKRAWCAAGAHSHTALSPPATLHSVPPPILFAHVLRQR